MLDVAKNFAVGTVVTVPTGTGGTSMVMATGHGARFGAPMNATLWDSGNYTNSVAAYWAGKAEVIRISANPTDTLTIVRGQEGTAAVDFTGLTCTLSAGITAARIHPNPKSFWHPVLPAFAGNTVGPSWPSGYGRQANAFSVFQMGHTYDARLVGRGAAMFLESTTGNGIALGSDIDGWSAPFNLNTGQELRFTIDVMLDTLSDATNDFTVLAGFANWFGGSGFNFRYRHSLNGGRFECSNQSRGATTLADSGVTVAVDTWYRLSAIQRFGQPTLFYINDVLVATIATNLIQTGSRDDPVGPCWGIQTRSAGTAARRFYWTDAAIAYVR